MEEYDIELDDMRVEDKPATRDNITAIERSLRKIQEILSDINERLKALE